MVVMMSRAVLCSVDDNSYSTVGQWTQTVCTPYTNSHLQRRHVYYDGYRILAMYFTYTLAGTTILTENTHDDVGKLYVFASVAQRIEHQCDAELRRRCEHWRRMRWNDGMAVTVAFFIDSGCSGNCRMYDHALSMSQDFGMCDLQLYIIMVGEYERGLSKVIDDLCN